MMLKRRPRKVYLPTIEEIYRRAAEERKNRKNKFKERSDFPSEEYQPKVVSLALHRKLKINSSDNPEFDNIDVT